VTRVAVVAGAGGGTGRACAVRLAECGMDVALIGADLAAADKTVRRIAEAGRRCTAIEADLTATGPVTGALAQVRATLGSPGVLVHCVPLDAGGDGPEARLAAMQRSLRTLFVCGRAVAAHMVRARWGRIVTVGEPAGTGERVWRDSQAVLAGLAGFTRSLALELAAFGVTANFAAPVSCSPDGRPPAHQPVPDAATGSYAEAVAHLAGFLAGDRAAAITGQGSYVAGRPAGNGI
jgi:NAD(P)-dependent dehydrogenase (short-subunit alcohol dehydrogenase family)